MLFLCRPQWIVQSMHRISVSRKKDALGTKEEMKKFDFSGEFSSK